MRTEGVRSLETLVMAGVLLMGGVFLATCGGMDGGPDPSVPPDESTQVGAFTLAPRGQTGSQPLVAGLPFAQGEVNASTALTLQVGDEPIATRWTPLSLWPDGSVRWARVDAVVALPTEGEELALTVWTGEGPQLDLWAPSLPPMRIEVVRSSGVVELPLDEPEPEQDGLGLRWSVEARPGGRARLVLRLAQVEGQDRWERITLHLDDDATADLTAATTGAAALGDLALAVPLFEERGPMSIEAEDGGLAVHLYAPSAGAPGLVADPDMKLSYQVEFQSNIAPEALAASVATPLRPRFDPAALNSTGAAGHLGPVGVSPAYDEALAASVAHLRALQTEDEHRGPRAWGDFRAGAEASLAYAGYINQEYDPASTLFQVALRTGDPAVMDMAVQMAWQYADNLSLEGGSYQHRSTRYAVIGTVADAHVPAMTQVLRSGGPPLDRAGLQDAITSILGDATAQDAIAWYDAWTSGDDEAREQATLGYVAWTFAKLGEGQAASGDEAVLSCIHGIWPDVDPAEVRIRDLAAATYCAKALALVPDRPDFAAVFEPFFARYGGTWDETGEDPFPVFHHYRVPDRQALHGGGHSLLEMLVWGHLLSGDQELREAALRAATFHVAEGEVIDRGVETILDNLERNGRAWVRNLGWPLINLGAARLLTMGGMDDALDAELLGGADTILDFLPSIDPSEYKSAIHVAVVSEGLARWHRQTGDERAEDLLLGLVEGWSADGDPDAAVVDPMWDEEAQGWRKEPGEDVVSGISCQLMYGVGYAAMVSDDPELTRRVARNFDTHCPISKGDAKSFAMGYRNSQRALALPWTDTR